MLKSLRPSRTKTISFLALLSTWLLLAGCPSSKKVVQQPEAEEPVIERPEPQAQPERSPEPEIRREETRPPLEPVVLENINFDYDKFDLTATARDILANHASVLRNRPEVSVQIEGHCDERGTIEYNLALGDKRAKAVANYLISLGVERSRLSTISFGKERPVDSRQNESAWAKNRRAEFRISN
ncbi:peptidoglycan-associated lipoprotein Pal [candidate division KSB1 bacterium]|nr:peptidoglycan-associated lipoprotein Pal [candidate division KSB1 bacterium]